MYAVVCKRRQEKHFTDCPERTPQSTAGFPTGIAASLEKATAVRNGNDGLSVGEMFQGSRLGGLYSAPTSPTRKRHGRAPRRKPRDSDSVALRTVLALE